MARYAVIKDKTIINMIEWDGKAPYNPGDGCKCYHESEIPKGTKPYAPEMPPLPTKAEQIAQLEGQLTELKKV